MKHADPNPMTPIKDVTTVTKYSFFLSPFDASYHLICEIVLVIRSFCIVAIACVCEPQAAVTTNAEVEVANSCRGC